MRHFKGPDGDAHALLELPFPRQEHTIRRQATISKRHAKSQVAEGPNLWASTPFQHLKKHAVDADSRFGLFLGDATDRLRLFPSASIHTCLTSPPYWSARDYEDDQQIGLEFDPEDYVAALVKVFGELRRVLKEDGTVWLNLGDCYLSGYNKSRRPWERNKQLALIPFRVAIALQEDGWLVRNALVWHKPNAMPASVRDRLANNWEPVFLLAKSESYFFNLDAIRVPHKTSDEVERRRAVNGHLNGKASGKKDLRPWLNSPRHRSTIEGLRQIRRRPNAPEPTRLAAYLRLHAEKMDLRIHDIAKRLDQPFERIRHYFRTDEIGSRLPPEATWDALRELLRLDTTYDDAMAIEIGDNVFRNHPKGRNPGDVQSFSLIGSGDSHFATMPESLVEWCLRASLPTGGICLDPFAGLSTTGRTAIDMQGYYFGIDIREDFLRLSAKSLRKAFRSSVGPSDHLPTK
jgi:DNA modification methylase